MTKGILLDFEGTVARRADGHLEPSLEEMRNLGYDVYRPELQAAYDFVLRVELPRKGYDDVEAFVEAVLKHLSLKPKRTELMALAPFFQEYHRFALHEDAERTVPALGKEHKVGIVAALPPFLVRPVLEALKTPLAVVTPKEAKAALPSPKVFRAAAAALALKPKDLTVVSADCADGLAVPKSLGFPTVFLRRRGNTVCPHADATIASLDELAELLKPPSSPAPVPATEPVRA